MTHAARQRRYRIRKALEREVARERDAIREVLGLTRSPACGCCGESRVEFLSALEGSVWCRNCAPFKTTGRLCPHEGVGRRLG